MENISFNPYQALFTATPELKHQLKMAHMGIEPTKFIKQCITSAGYLSTALAVVAFFVVSSQSHTKNIADLLVPVYVFVPMFILSYFFFYNSPLVYMRKREREIERNIVFATRYLILKMDGGQPLLNSMISASRSYGVGGKFFQEIVDDVQLGKPIEQSIEEAWKNTPSKLFQLVLRQILNALRTGTDVSGSLRKILEEIGRKQQIQIKEYSKKLNSLVLFYLIVACVIPSLGISMFLMVGSMMGLVLDIKTYILLLFMLLSVQLMFIGVFKSIKPMVEI